MKKICSGARREGIKWFTELFDKGKTMKYEINRMCE